MINSISKAIIPVAGHGTRLYPYTKIINKEFSPVIHNSMLKPQIAVLLENIYDAGIKKICLCVSSKQQIEMYNKFFLQKLDYIDSIKNIEEKIKYERKLNKIGKCLQFVINKDVDKGFGYSVSLFKEFANNEPVIMLLGDTIYKANDSSNDCITQLLNAYKELNKPIIGVTKIDLKDANRYGICEGKFIDNNIMKIERFIEKPSIEFVKNNMLIEKNNKKYCYKVFGNYVLTPYIFEKLDKFLKISKGEAQLSEALNNVSQEDILYGIEINGTTLDFGNIQSYAKNFTNI